jgi:hypothetical protein
MFIAGIAGLLFAYFFIHVAGFHMVLKRILKRPGRLKPFDCLQCLTVWSVVILYFLPIEISNFLTICLGAGYFSTIFKK